MGDLIRPGLTLTDARGLIGDGRVSPTRPDDPRSVAACFEDPQLTLALVAHKSIVTYEAWLWEGNDGQAYYSKRMANGRTMAWKPGATVSRVLRANPSWRKYEHKQGQQAQREKDK